MCAFYVYGLRLNPGPQLSTEGQAVFPYRHKERKGRRELIDKHLQPEGCLAEAREVLGKEITHYHRYTDFRCLLFDSIKIFPESLFKFGGLTGL